MSRATAPRWHSMRNTRSDLVEQVLRNEFANADAYRYNSASIRVRVIDDRFDGLSDEDRDAIVEPFLKQLPEDIQDDIINLLTLTKQEADPRHFSRYSLLNLEFEDPSPSSLL